MTISGWLSDAQTQLNNAKIDTARLDCLVLLADILGKDKSWLLSHSDYELQGSILEKLNTKVAQRALHIPLAYLRGHAEFYGREFWVNENTLVPRPETEAMIELLQSLQLPAQAKILDIGTGSGCIAITTALELPSAQLSACDIDPHCLEIAQKNAAKLGANVTFFESDLLLKSRPQDVLLTNLPYVPNNFFINTAATHEPRLALFGGPDGLDLYRALLAQVSNADWRPQYIITESLPTQHAELAQMAAAAGFTLQTANDFIQLFKYQDKKPPA